MFFNPCEKNWEDLVNLVMYLSLFLPWFVEVVADMSLLHHQIDQAFPIFLARIEKHGKAWVRDENKESHNIEGQLARYVKL